MYCIVIKALFFKQEPFFNVNYLADYISENYSVLKSKFKQPVFSYLTWYIKNNRSMIINLEYLRLLWKLEHFSNLTILNLSNFINKL